jgi:pimeloyl-ACP methyl ester carboxylesterase
VQLLLKNIQWQEAAAGGSSNTLEWKFNLKAIVKNMHTIGDTFKLKDQIEIPTLFIRAENSDYILEEDISSIKKTFPNSEFQTIAGAGHWVHADKPGEFSKSVNEWILLP